MDTGSIEVVGGLVLLFGSLFGAFAVSTVRTGWALARRLARTVWVQIASKNDGVFARNTSHIVTFRAEDGETLKISVTGDMAYYQMTKGMYGTLTFRGWNYKNFVPSEPPVTFPSSPPN